MVEDEGVRDEDPVDTAGTTPPGTPPPRGKDREVMVGIFVMLGLISGIMALLALTDAALFRGRYIITTQVPDAGGIRRGDPVQMRGVNIGRIQRFKIGPDGVAIRLEIEGEYPIPNDSHVELKAYSLLGGMVADVVPGSSPKSFGNGDTISGQTQKGFEKITQDLTDKVQTVLGRVDTLLDKQMIANVHQSSAELNNMLKQLSATTVEQRAELKALTTSLRTSAESLKTTTANAEKVTGAPEIDRALKRIDTVTARLDETTASLGRSSKSMESVMGRVDRGEGTLGKLTRDDALYNNMNKAATNLNELAEDIRKNPKKYLSVKVF